MDGGFSKKATFWDFSRHLDRLDAILITRISDDNAGGMSALLQRKTMSATYPQIGHVFANLPHSEKLSEAGQAEKGKYKKYIASFLSWVQTWGYTVESGYGSTQQLGR